jgi:triacylglycerol lipase
MERHSRMRRYEIHRGVVDGSLWRLFRYGARPGDLDADHCCGRPLLLLYGFLGVPPTIAVLARRLAREGRCVLSFDLGGWLGRLNTSRIDALAETVAAEVEALAEQGALRSLDVIGYSEGGLIGRHYVQRLGGSTRVRHLITLATPHRGTPLAYLGYLFTRMASLRQMTPNSSFLRGLPDDQFPGSTRLTSIYCRGDVVCPPSACRLDDRFGEHLKNVELETGNHLDFLFRTSLLDAVCAELGPASRPAAAARRATRAGRVERGATGVRRVADRAASSA